MIFEILDGIFDTTKKKEKRKNENRKKYSYKYFYISNIRCKFNLWFLVLS